MTANNLPKIAVVVPSLEEGGGVPAVARFVIWAALNSGKFEIRLISLCSSNKDPQSVSLLKPINWFIDVSCRTDEWEGIPFTHVGAFWGEIEFQRYRPRKALTALLDDCAIIQVVSGSPASANAVVGLNRKVALQVATRAKIERRMRDAKPRNLASLWRKLMTEITDRFDDRALQKVDAVQVESPWMLEYAQKTIGNRKVDLRYAPPGVDTNLFTVPEQLNVSCNLNILLVGRLSDPRKNVCMLLEAYALLPADIRQKCCLQLAGQSEPPSIFWKRAAELGCVEKVKFILKPSINELISLYQNASVFALPSDEEGFGMVIIESMACGTPVVATKCGGPDGIISDGIDGFLVSPNRAQEMSDRLAQLLCDEALRYKMGMAARRKIENSYDMKITGSVFVDMWEELLDKID